MEAKASLRYLRITPRKVRVVAETYRLDEIRKAYERVERGEVRFRAVVTM